MKKEKKFTMPHGYIILLIVMLFVTVLTYIVPSGEFLKEIDPVTGNEVINTEVFNYIEKTNPVSFLDFFAAIHDGIIAAMSVGATVMIVTGAIYVLEQTGAIGAGIHKLVGVARGKETLIIALILLVFTLIGSCGIVEEVIPFMPIVVSIVMALGYDRLAGFATIAFGMCIGFASGAVNIFTTGIAQEIVGLPLFSWIGFRFLALVVFYLITLAYLLRYCKKIKADPSKSLIPAFRDGSDFEEIGDFIELNKKRAVLLLVFAGIFVLQVFGALQLDWGLSQIAALYLMYIVFTTIVYRLNVNEVCRQFTKGAESAVIVVFMIGIAQAIMLIMNQGQIIDTGVYWVSSKLQGHSPLVALFLIYATIMGFNFFVLSGVGKAMFMMPILGPIAKILGINQQVIILAYIYGDGFTNFIYPTSGLLHAMLGMCKLDYGTWVKFSLKLFITLAVAGYFVILIGNFLQLGPF